jgi:hypothetical protein
VLPADVQWTVVAGVALPVSPATGPAQSTGGLARGFAHTAAGAVVAAAHLLVRTTAQVGPRVFEPTLDEQVVGEYASAMRRAVENEYRDTAAARGIPYGEPLGDLPARVAGVLVVAYSDQQATLSILTQAVDATGVTRFAATTLTVMWQAGDWRLVAPLRGTWDTQVRIIAATDVHGYAPWPAG